MRRRGLEPPPGNPRTRPSTSTPTVRMIRTARDQRLPSLIAAGRDASDVVVVLRDVLMEAGRSAGSRCRPTSKSCGHDAGDEARGERAGRLARAPAGPVGVGTGRMTDGAVRGTGIRSHDGAGAYEPGSMSGRSLAPSPRFSPRLLAAVLAVVVAAALAQCARASASPTATVGMPFSGKWAYNVNVDPPYTDGNSSHPSVHTNYYWRLGDRHLRARGDPGQASCLRRRGRELWLACLREWRVWCSGP